MSSSGALSRSRSPMALALARPLACAPSPRNFVQIYVMMPKGNLITLDVFKYSNVWDVKSAIQEKYRGPRFLQGFWTEDQRLIFAGKQLEDGQGLPECNIVDQCLIWCELTEEAAAGKGVAWKTAGVVNEVEVDVAGASSSKT